jgi:hypothetical protein
MKETAILFTPDNIRAIVEGRKTQTRRTMNPQWTCDKPDAYTVEMALRHCRHGKAGDRMWVKEGWGIGGARLIDPTVNYRAGGQMPLIGHASPDMWSIHGNRNEVNDADLLKVKDGWHNAMFMPKWAARLWLEITDVRVERVQDISEADCIAEGCPKEYLLGVNWYRALWDEINGKTHPWSENPWTWVLTFKVVK